MLAAMEQNSIEVAAAECEPNLQAERAANLSTVQLAVGEFAAALARSSPTPQDATGSPDEVFVVTVNRDLVAYCQRVGLRTIAPDEAARHLPPPSSNLLRLAMDGARRSAAYYSRSIKRDAVTFVPLLIVLLLIVRFRDPVWDLLQAQPLASALLCLVVALYAFWIRSKRRLLYAAIEIMIALDLSTRSRPPDAVLYKIARAAARRHGDQRENRPRSRTILLVLEP